MVPRVRNTEIAYVVRSIQIIRDAFFPILDPTGRTPFPILYGFKLLEKMSRDTLTTAPTPLAAYAFSATHPPQVCHVLFE